MTGTFLTALEYIHYTGPNCSHLPTDVVACVHVTETSDPRGYFPRHGNGRVEPRMRRTPTAKCYERIGEYGVLVTFINVLINTEYSHGV